MADFFFPAKNKGGLGGDVILAKCEKGLVEKLVYLSHQYFKAFNV